MKSQHPNFEVIGSVNRHNYVIVHSINNITPQDSFEMMFI